MLRRILLVLLMVAGLNYPAGTVVTEPPPGGGVFSLTTAPDGGWTVVNHPKAVYYNGYTYFTWIAGTGTGPAYVASYKHADGTISTPVQIDGMSGTDTHNTPALLVRDSDHKLMIAFSLHDGPSMFIRLSTTSLDTDPDLGDGLAAPVNLDASIGASDYTYPSLLQLTGVTNDPIYLIYRDISGSTGRIAYSKSTNGGTTWSARTLLLTGTAGNIPYFIVRGSTTRVDIYSTDRAYNGSEGAVDLGHFYLDGSDDKVYTSDATEITATKPFDHAELTQLETNATGAIAEDGIVGTNSVMAYLVDNGDSTITAKYRRWDGASWDSADIYTEAHFPVDRAFGGLAINRTDPEEVFSGIKSGTSTSELYSYTSGDLGLTWDGGTAMTTGSGDLNAAVIAVENADATLPAVWLRGTITSSSNFNFGIRGLAR